MEEIYVNVEHAKPVDARPSTNQTSPRSPESRFHGAVVLFLGLLSVFLLAGLITLGVLYRDSSSELSTIKANLSSVSEERDLLNANLTEATKELNRLQSLSKQKKTCPAGWRMFSCTCYLLSTEYASWEKGREDCRNRGADLVVIDSYEEQEFLTKFKEGSSVWIGLNDRDSEGTWKWTDETPLTLEYWLSMQPDNGRGDPRWGEEDCAHINASKETKNWNDLRCDASLQWICEKLA
ncbi:C-type lectin domain family 4 member E-like isoform X2 [Siniperca chuatsi]|uniref:C-type lectin domain family 4 member E-like isoform X2 n=1 Tax=Siniperca chuatsi TaxID=119488 RepID=UPI001CE03891|nr:C-type lectin domain family 4 member E-like isoform X2 [Siniperca chuatsi]